MKDNSDMAKTTNWKDFAVFSIRTWTSVCFKQITLVLKIFNDTYFIETDSFQLKMMVLKDPDCKIF